MELTQETKELINEYIKLNKDIELIKDKSTNITFCFLNKKLQKTYKVSLKAIKRYINFKDNKTSLNLNIKIEKNTKPHEKIKIISFGINESEYKQLKEIAQKNNLTLNNLLKQITKQVIKQNI